MLSLHMKNSLLKNIWQPFIENCIERIRSAYIIVSRAIIRPTEITMRAAVLTRQGDPTVLSIRDDYPMPQISKNQGVLIRVKAIG